MLKVEIAGISHFGTEAAADLMSNPTLLSEALAQMTPGWERKNVQLVLHMKVIGGAKPDTAYAVVLLLFAGSCSGPLAFPFANGAVLTTDAHGNAHGQVKITPDEVASFGLHDTDWGITWTLVAGGVAAYTTDCSQVHID